MSEAIRTEADRERVIKLMRARELPCTVSIVDGLPRSSKQNAALFGVAYPPIMEHMGLRGEAERKEIHEYFCGEYWGWKEKVIFGKKKHTPKRTTTRNEEGKRDLISKPDMCDFYAFVQHKGAESGVFVPDPDPMY